MIDSDNSSLLSYQEFKSVFLEGDYLLSDTQTKQFWEELLTLMDRGDNDG
jgi:hypothetical protein